MRAIVNLAVCGLIVCTAAGADDARKGARAIDVKGLKAEMPRGEVMKPAKITSEKELAAAIPDKEWQQKVGKQVDFAKEQLVYFTWSGSGGDKLTTRTEDAKDKTVVVFLLERGLTRDFRPHVHLFAVPKDATWRVEDKK